MHLSCFDSTTHTMTKQTAGHAAGVGASAAKKGQRGNRQPPHSAKVLHGCMSGPLKLHPPSLVNFTKNSAEEEVWWHTHSRKSKGEFISNPGKTWRPRPLSARARTTKHSFARSPKPPKPDTGKRSNAVPSARAAHPNRAHRRMRVEKSKKEPQRRPTLNLPKRKKGPGPSEQKQSVSRKPVNTPSRREKIKSRYDKKRRNSNPRKRLQSLDDCEEENTKYSWKKVEPVEEVFTKYFKDKNRMATIAMEQMVSDLTEKVLEVRKSKRGDEGDEEQVLSGILGPLNNTLHQEDIVETRDLLKRAEKEIVRLLGIETSKLSIEVNTLQSKATERKRVLHDLKVEYANRESQMKLVMGSLGVIGKKFREAKALEEEASGKLEAIQNETLKLNYMLTRDIQYSLVSKKRAMQKSQEIKAVRRHFNALEDLGNEAMKSQEEAQSRIDRLTLEKQKQVHLLNSTLQNDKKKAGKIEKAILDLEDRKEKRKMIKAGHEFDDMHNVLHSQGKSKMKIKSGALLADSDNVLIKYGEKSYKWKELENILGRIHRRFNFSAGEVTPEAWLLDIYRQESREQDMHESIQRTEKEIKEKQKEIGELKGLNEQLRQHEIKSKPNGEGGATALAASSDASDGEASRSSSMFIRHEQMLQDKLRESDLLLLKNKMKVDYAVTLVKKATMGIATLMRKISRSDLPIPYAKSLTANTETSSIKNNLRLYQQAVLTVDAEVRKAADLHNRPTAPIIENGDLIFDAKKHTFSLAGEFNNRVECEDETKLDPVLEIDDHGLNQARREELKKKMRRTLNLERRKSSAASVMFPRKRR